MTFLQCGSFHVSSTHHSTIMPCHIWTGKWLHSCVDPFIKVPFSSQLTNKSLPGRCNRYSAHSLPPFLPYYCEVRRPRTIEPFLSQPTNKSLPGQCNRYSEHSLPPFLPYYYEVRRPRTIEPIFSQPTNKILPGQCNRYSAHSLPPFLPYYCEETIALTLMESHVLLSRQSGPTKSL